MTYTAPRLGLFAIITLVSLTLNLLFFVLHTQRQLTDKQASNAQQQVLLLSQELATPLSINDRISMSVVANRYLQLGNLAFVGVYDVNDRIIVPLGLESSSGVLAEEMITNHDNVLGKVVVHTTPVSRAQIISDNWIYLAAVALLHIFLWFVYSHMARPSKSLRLEIAHQVRDRLLAKGLLETVKHDSHASQDEAESGNHSSSDDGIMLHDKDGSLERQISKTYLEDKGNKLVVQVRFDDPNQLLDTIGQQTKTLYFSLCQQLVEKATQELAALPVFSGVAIHEVSDFDDDGCQIVLVGKNEFAKSALASVMLARLILMLNRVIYDKHRELKRFALPVRTYVSDVSRQMDVLGVGVKHKEGLLVLLSPKHIASLAQHGNFQKMFSPTSVAERECRYVKQLSESNVERLEKLRDKVLMSA